jgi:hypothetical protein
MWLMCLAHPHAPPALCRHQGPLCFRVLPLPHWTVRTSAWSCAAGCGSRCVMGYACAASWTTVKYASGDCAVGSSEVWEAWPAAGPRFAGMPCPVCLATAGGFAAVAAARPTWVTFTLDSWSGLGGSWPLWGWVHCTHLADTGCHTVVRGAPRGARGGMASGEPRLQGPGCLSSWNTAASKLASASLGARGKRHAVWLLMPDQLHCCILRSMLWVAWNVHVHFRLGHYELISRASVACGQDARVMRLVCSP